MKLEYLKSFSNSFEEYTELRLQENKKVSLVLVNGNLVNNIRTTKGGISARVYKDGVFGFASTPVIDEQSVKGVISKAKENAYILDNIEKKAKGSLFEEGFEIIKDFSTKKNRVSRRDMLDYLQALHSYTQEKYPDLVSNTFVLNNLDMEKNLLSSFGTSAYTMIPRSILMLFFSYEKDGEIYESFDTMGGLGQFEDFFNEPEKIYNKIESLYKKVREKSEGVYPEAGYHDVILDSKLAGILAHEAIGHTTEADLVKSGSIAKDYLNEKVASEIVSLVDFAHEYKGMTCPVPIFVDDEGTRPEDVVIIKDGILKRYMNNKVFANDFGDRPTGNARAFDFSDEPLVRMRNTAILPGNDKLEDMISSIDKGYYLIDTNNGQADSTSEFMFGITCAYEIKDGKLGPAIKDTTISGVAFDMLKTVSMISDDMFWSNSGMCGKKQMIPVGMGGPAIKCKINIGGK